LNSKTCEMALSELLKLTKEPNITIAIPLAELEHVFGLPGNDVESALSSLSKDGIITVRFCPSDISICVLPAAFGYFQEKQEAEKRQNKLLIWEIFKWALPIILSILSLAKFYEKEITSTWQQLTQLWK